MLFTLLSWTFVSIPRKATRFIKVWKGKSEYFRGKINKPTAAQEGMRSAEIIQKYRLDKRAYTHKGFNGVLHYFFVCGELFQQNLKDYFGEGHNFTAVYYDQKDSFYSYWYYDDAQLEKIRNLALSKAQKDKKFLPTILKDWHAKLKLLEKQYLRVDTTDLRTLSDRQL